MSASTHAAAAPHLACAFPCFLSHGYPHTETKRHHHPTTTDHHHLTPIGVDVCKHLCRSCDCRWCDRRRGRDPLPKAHIDNARWLASLTHAALLVLQADSAESRITVPGLVLLFRVTCGPQAAVSVRICLQSGFCITGRHLEHIHICLQHGSASAPWSHSKSNMYLPIASNGRPLCPAAAGTLRSHHFENLHGWPQP